MPTWRAFLLITSLAFCGTLYLAWRKVPGFEDSLRLLWGDAKEEARERAK